MFVLLIHLWEIVQHVVYVRRVSPVSIVNVPYFQSIHVHKIHVDLTVLVFAPLIHRTIVFVQMVSLANHAIPVRSVPVPVHLVDIYPHVNKSKTPILPVINVFVPII